MSTYNPDSPLPPGAEEALFQRLLRRLSEASQEAAAGAEAVAGVVASAAGSAASSIYEVAGGAADWAATSAKDAVDYSTAMLTALTAQKIVESRRNKEEPIAQLLFRVPESLRDEVRRLSVDEKRQMDELLTEAVLDLLLKHGRTPHALQKHAPSDIPVKVT